jgi:tetratricopeptide (TPR) repeat protein
MKKWSGIYHRTWNRPAGEKEVLDIPVKTDRMKQTSLWLIIFLAGIISACSVTKKTVKTESVQSGQTTESPEERKKEFEYLFIEALKQKMVGNPQKAVSLLSNCLEIDPNSSSAMYELANLHIMGNDLTSASLLLEKAISINPGNKWFKLLLVKIYEQNGKYGESANLFDQLSKSEPDNQEYLYMKAMQLAKAKKYEESIKAFNDLEKLTGINPQISAEKQNVFLQAGKVKEAFAEIQKLIGSNPSDPRYYGLLADLYKDQGDNENALKYYKKIEEMDPGNGFVNFSLSDFFQGKGDTLQAYQYLLKGFANDGVDVDTKLQLYLMHEGNHAPFQLTPQQTEQLIKILVEKYPDDFRIYAVYAEYLAGNKQNKEAREILLKAIESGGNEFAIWEHILYLDNDLLDWQSLLKHSKSAIDLFPNQAQFYFLRAIAELQLEKFVDAIKTADEGLNYVVDNKALNGQLIFLKGEADYKMNNVNEAFGYFDKAIELDPDNFIALNNYAYYLSLAERDLEKAERMSGRVIEKYPDNATYLDTYAWVLFKKKNYSLARFYMETALNHSETENPTLIDHYGDILYMLGNTDEAVVKWKKALDLGGDSKVLKQKIAEKKYIGEK